MDRRALLALAGGATPTLFLLIWLLRPTTDAGLPPSVLEKADRPAREESCSLGREAPTIPGPVPAVQPHDHLEKDAENLAPSRRVALGGQVREAPAESSVSGATVAVFHPERGPLPEQLSSPTGTFHVEELPDSPAIWLRVAAAETVPGKRSGAGGSRSDPGRGPGRIRAG